jgi:AraC-like DNA-binding protein
MDLRNIAGIHVYSVHQRRDFRPLYYSRTFEGEAHSILFLVEKGVAYFDFGQGTIKAASGHLLCYESSVLNSIRGDPDSPPSYLVLTFDLLNRLGGLIRPGDIGIPFLFKPGENRGIVRTFRALHGEWTGKRDFYQIECSILGLRLLRKLSEAALTERTSVTHRGIRREDDRIAAALEHIRLNYKDDLRIGTLSKMAGLKPGAFMRRFRKVTGMTVRRYILERKIEQAKDHLLTDNISFSQTAEELGFRDYSNFYKAFRKITGMTPLDYYRRQRPAVT